MAVPLVFRRCLSTALILCVLPTLNCEESVEYEGYDGWYNNLINPDWGAVDGHLLRRLPVGYEDSVYEPSGYDRPNPINISDSFMKGDIGKPSSRNRTALLVFFGQQVVEEILDAQRPGCPPEYFNIEIPKGHEQYDNESRGGYEIPLLRSRYDQRTGFSPNNPRQQLNEITPYIDGGLFYGVSKAWADTLRAFEGGLLAADGDKHREDNVFNSFPVVNTIRLPMANPPPPYKHQLFPVKRHFRLGNPRGNENPFLLTWGIVWFRYHNWWAKKLQEDHPEWEDEKLFNEARKWVIGIYQKVVMYDWLPAWISSDVNELGTCLDTTDIVMTPTGGNVTDNNTNMTRDYGPAGKYEKYNPYVHPGIAQEFQSAAMRFGHTLVPPGVLRRDKECNFRDTNEQGSLGTEGGRFKGLRTCNTFWLSKETFDDLSTDIDEVIMGMAAQVTEKEDHIITPDLRGFVFGGLEFSRRDLMAVNIQRGRDHGLPDYNTARKFYGLDPVTDWDDINTYYKGKTDEDAMAYQKALSGLEAAYDGDISKLDIWPGGLAETTPCGPGELFSRIIVDQFQRIRDADRFWFENKLNGLFTDEEREEIWSITLKDILVQVTGIGDEDIQDNPFFFEGSPCDPGFQLNASHLEECTPKQTFDYFSGSEVSYALSFLCLGLVAVGVILLMIFLSKRRQAKVRTQSRDLRLKQRTSSQPSDSALSAVEWVGPKDGRRQILVKLMAGKGAIEIVSACGAEKKLRLIDLHMTKKLFFHLAVKDERFLVIKVPKEYDLALKFDDPSQRRYFIDKMEAFLRECSVARERVELPEKVIRKNVVTKRHRQQRLEMFFKVVFAQAFHLEQDREDVANLNSDDAKEVVTTELSRLEFAEALSMKPNSLFLNNLYPLVDKDNDGYVTFREFLDFMVIFAKGSPEDKARLLFNMYDVNQSGRLSRIEFSSMLRSLIELANNDVDPGHLDQLMDSMTSDSGIGRKDHLDLKDFTKMLNGDSEILNYARLGWKVSGQERVPNNIPNRARKTFHDAYSKNVKNQGIQRPTSSVNVTTTQRKYPESNVPRIWYLIEGHVANYKREIFWVTLYTLVTFGIFIERAYYYSIEREHAGLRRIAGYGVTITRGAASVMMWTYSTLLITMCRNLITFLRETIFHRFIPFDGAISFHKYIAFWALVFTVIHCIGHAINFYHISTQTANDLTCLFRDFFHATHELPKFHYWLYSTITGMTGVLLTIHVIVLYTFALQYSRRSLFMAFWLTHSTYIVFYVFMVMHGSGRLVQPPLFQNFFLGPIILFTLDKMVSFSRKKVEIPVVRAEHLPSDVLCLVFRRPQNFEYKSGQWVRIASLKLGTREYHPFTLTSAPHEEHLSLHIRAVGPWTTNLRKTYNPANRTAEKPYPKIYLDGPFGEGHQDWYKYQVAVLVGGGIGVTPFASILKDIVAKSRTGFKFPCQKVYFLWVTRTQKQFEWLTEIIRDVEQADDKKLVDVHIFITQFFQKFDMRTTLLYVCERHFQKISGKSLFTGLQSITHFGRPDFTSFLDSLQDVHPGVNQVGVFSCGPPPMTNDVDKACSNLNKIEGPTFSHHFENF